MKTVVLFNKNPSADAWLAPLRLLVLAAIFHLAVTGAVYALGHYTILPGTFDTNGIAISFASDGIGDRADAARLSELLRRGRIREWATAPLEFHLKLYSICFALFGPWLGLTIVSIEPLNLLCYLAILILVFRLGREAFNPHAATIAAVVVGLWPSLLLHTTQILKDPMFIVGMLAFVLVTLRLLSRSLSWSGALIAGSVGGLIALFVWLARDSMGQLLIVTAILGALILLAQQLHEKRIHKTNVVGMALLFLISVGVTTFVPGFNKPAGASRTTTGKQHDHSPEKVRTKISEELQTNTYSGLAGRVGTLRRRFVLMYPDSTSNIDSDVQLTSIAEIVRYLPRAAVIGFFAPFPKMWFASGRQVGSAGRLLSGIETLAMYAIEALAIFGLWTERRRSSVWLLFSTAALGLIALGLVVVNVGTLYRLRYVFLILIIIVAAKGFTDLCDWYENRRRG